MKILSVAAVSLLTLSGCSSRMAHNEANYFLPNDRNYAVKVLAWPGVIIGGAVAVPVAVISYPIFKIHDPQHGAEGVFAVLAVGGCGGSWLTGGVPWALLGWHLNPIPPASPVNLATSR